MYDVIVVGARVAGASTAMLLARRGLRVLCLDKATFPSDTLSTHQIQLPGVARLNRWGLLDAIAARTPAAREVRFDTGKIVLEGRFPSFDGIDAVYGPRRILLDKILVDAARASGAELREDFVVEGLTSLDKQVTGVRGRTRNGQIAVEKAPLVVGADGKRSLVAKAVGAPTYFEKPLLSAVYYGYWEGLELKQGELYERHRRAISAWPTSDGQSVLYVGLPIGEFPSFRSDVGGNFFAALSLAGDLAHRVRGARQVGRLKGSANLPNWFRKPYGPGWALVGDAGLVMDPISGQGIGHAVRDAELLADAIEKGLGGKRKIESAMRAYEKERNRHSLPMYKMTTQQAAMDPPTYEKELLYRSLVGNPAEIEAFFGLVTGVISSTDYMSLSHMWRVLGLRGIAGIILHKVSGGRWRAASAC